METGTFLSTFSKVIADLGLAGMVIVMLILSNVVLWRALQGKNRRMSELVDRSHTQSIAVNTMLERIIGRAL